MFYFASRTAARAYAARVARQVVDMGADAARRWAVQVV